MNNEPLRWTETNHLITEKHLED